MLKEFNDAPEIPKAVFLTICIFVYEMETSICFGKIGAS